MAKEHTGSNGDDAVQCQGAADEKINSSARRSFYSEFSPVNDESETQPKDTQCDETPEYLRRSPSRSAPADRKLSEQLLELCLSFNISTLEEGVSRLFRTSHALNELLGAHMFNVSRSMEIYEKLSGELLNIEGLHSEVRDLISRSKVLVLKNMTRYISEILALQLEMRISTENVSLTYFTKQKSYHDSEKVRRHIGPAPGRSRRVTNRRCTKRTSGASHTCIYRR